MDGCEMSGWQTGKTHRRPRRFTRAVLGLLVAAGLSAFAPAEAGDTPADCWTGVTEAGPEARRIVVELFDEGRPGAPGSIHLFGAQVTSRSLASAAAGQDGALRFAVEDEFGSVSFQGQPGTGDDRIDGTITIDGSSYPLALAPAPGPNGANEALHGFWSGTLKAGAVELRLVLELSAGPCGTLFGRAHSPDQGANDLPLTGLEIEGTSLRFALGQLGAVFEGALDAERTRAVGTFTQNGVRMPLELSHGSDPPRRGRPQDPAPPFPYDSVDVTFANSSAGLELAGTLTLPRGEGPFPAAVLVSGSGQQDRDESLFGHKPFLVLADRLTRAGVAVLRYDDRGVGGSGGDPATATSADFATDTAAAFDFLRGDERIDAARVGIVGHSEGGLIAPLVAAEREDVAFIVLWAGPGVPGREILLRQSELIMVASGAGRPMVEAQEAYSRRFYEILASEPDDAAAAAAIIEAARGGLPGLSEDQRTAWGFATAMVPDEQLQAQARQLASPWFRFFIAHDPRESLARVRCPVLGLWGSLDLQVDPPQNVPEVAEALARARNPHHALVTLPGLNHMMQPASSGLVAEYGKIETTIDPSALDLMTDWIAGVVSRDP